MLLRKMENSSGKLANNIINRNIILFGICLIKSISLDFSLSFLSLRK